MKIVKKKGISKLKKKAFMIKKSSPKSITNQTAS